MYIIMKVANGFISITAIIALILGVGIVGGGTYYVVNKNKQEKVVISNISTDDFLLDSNEEDSERLDKESNAPQKQSESSQVNTQTKILTSSEYKIENVNSSSTSNENFCKNSLMVLTQECARKLILEKWNINFCTTTQECKDPEITIEPDRGNMQLITVITTEFDDSVSRTKREGLVSFDQVNGWYWSPIQPEPSVQRTCHRGNSDGTMGWTTGPCI